MQTRQGQRQTQLQQEAYRFLAARSNVHEVTYQVFGTGHKVDVAYDDGGKELKRIKQAKLPWSKTLRLIGNAQVFLAVSSKQANADLVAQILVDGHTFKEQRANGQYTELICEGTIGQKPPTHDAAPEGAAF